MCVWAGGKPTDRCVSLDSWLELAWSGRHASRIAGGQNSYLSLPSAVHYRGKGRGMGERKGRKEREREKDSSTPETYIER